MSSDDRLAGGSGGTDDRAGGRSAGGAGGVGAVRASARGVGAGSRVTGADLVHLRRAVELARLALERGDEPFGSVLVSGEGKVLFEDHNHVVELDETQHPELAIARWAGARLTPPERAAATVYTSGEHCAMCSAAHGWVGLGRIVYAASTEQLVRWRASWGASPSRVRALAITDVVPGAVVAGPVPELEDEVRDLHERFARRHPPS
jgi:tRNA(Arg) A34 adenosine deaminase TadA